MVSPKVTLQAVMKPVSPQLQSLLESVDIQPNQAGQRFMIQFVQKMRVGLVGCGKSQAKIATTPTLLGVPMGSTIAATPESRMHTPIFKGVRLWFQRLIVNQLGVLTTIAVDG